MRQRRVDRPDEPVRSKSSHRGGNRDATDEAFRGHKRCAPGEQWANDSLEAMRGSRHERPHRGMCVRRFEPLLVRRDQFGAIAPRGSSWRRTPRLEAAPRVRTPRRSHPFASDLSRNPDAVGSDWLSDAVYWPPTQLALAPAAHESRARTGQRCAVLLLGTPNGDGTRNRPSDVSDARSEYGGPNVTHSSLHDRRQIGRPRTSRRLYAA